METRSTISPLLGPLVISFSAASFWSINRILDCGFIPKSAEQQTWRFKNIFVSLVHALIAGIWSLLCFYHDPKLAEDVISTHSSFSYALVSFSVGYFIHDSIDMLSNYRHKESYELLGHHVVVLICFGVAVVKHTYVGYGVVSLIVEVNGVFLHIRQLLQVCGYKKNNNIYRLNSLINLGTFICFRIATLGWMTRWIALHKDLVPLLYYTIGSVGLALVLVMNIVLFYRLIVSDFGKKSRETSHRNNNKQN